MADGSRGDHGDPNKHNEITLFGTNSELDDTKKCSEDSINDRKLKLPYYVERNPNENCENSDSNSVVVELCALSTENSSGNSSVIPDEDRKKRCTDRYDSSESSDSGVAVLSPTESGGCSGSDITEPASPSSPESSSGVSEENAVTRMPPWVCDPAPQPGARRLAPDPVPAPPARRPLPPPPPLHRRITEYFNHKMKPHNGLKRDSTSTSNNSDAKKKCLPNKNAAQDLEKYISLLSQTLNPRVLYDVGKQQQIIAQKIPNSSADYTNNSELKKVSPNVSSRHVEINKQNDINVKVHGNVNGVIDMNKQIPESSSKEKVFFPKKGHIETTVLEKSKIQTDPSANGVTQKGKHLDNVKKLSAAQDLNGIKIGQVSNSEAKKFGNSITLNPIAPKISKSPSQPSKRSSRKSSSCIANNKNLSWSKVNNLKQVELQKQNCVNSVSASVSNMNADTNSTNYDKTKINKMPNGVQQVPITMNGNLNNINMPVGSLQNCHPINLHQQACNGTVPQTNLTSFVTVPSNVMLTTLRIPQNGIPAQHNNMTFAQQNVSSPTKINGQFMFPLVQNINGAVVQIPNLMTKVPNFVLPQTPQRTDHLQNQQAAQFLINGTLLKLSNTLPSTYPNMNKNIPPTSQSLSSINKGISGIGLPVQAKPNFTVNLSHPMLVPQPGFIVTSVPNINVKETWSNNSTHTTSTTQNVTCSNPIAQHPPPIVTNFSSQGLHTSSIPIAPVKPPDNPIQGTDPPSSTVTEPEQTSINKKPKCDIPWLAKTVNNNNVLVESKKIPRPFTELCSESEKLPTFSETENVESEKVEETVEAEMKIDKTSEEIRRLEEVARREETLFTQITVLKDVSCNVQNSVIDSNYSSSTPESSESGIGTDKSIDSPSDSQTSKECDEDSSLSLSVSVCSVEVPSSQKSPILKEPKTLRFPPREKPKNDNQKRSPSADVTPTITVCLWQNCKQEFEHDTDLLEHLQAVHVESQAGQEQYRCQWERCKVKGKPSCSRLWLERHALSHGGNKPFKCIVDGCGRRFSTQNLLERHVNQHFTEQPSSAGSGKKATDSAPKLIRRNGKKVRYRRQPWSARMFDVWDSGAMEALAWRLAAGAAWRGGCPLRGEAGHALRLAARVAATRRSPAPPHRREALLTYHPPHVLEDEWVPESEVCAVKLVEIASLPAHVKVLVFEQYRAATAAATPPPPPAGAAKRKMGRRHGGNAFWPCGR